MCALGLTAVAENKAESVLVSGTMSITVCIAPAKTLEYPEGGGHLWAYLNWALGLRALGCQVIWLEAITRPTSADAIRANVAALKLRLKRYGLVNCLALHSSTDEALPIDLTSIGCLDLDAAQQQRISY